MKICWDGVAAIGQWAGAIATFLAVIISLRTNKPKVKVYYKIMTMRTVDSEYRLGDIVNDNILMITAVNIGIIPVKIVDMGLTLSKEWLTIVPVPGELPKILMPLEEISIKTDVKKLKNNGINRFDLAYAIDSSGKLYNCDTGIFKRITRFLGLKLGYYNYRRK